jgi:hypothetical protein
VALVCAAVACSGDGAQGHEQATPPRLPGAPHAASGMGAPGLEPPPSSSAEAGAQSAAGGVAPQMVPAAGSGSTSPTAAEPPTGVIFDWPETDPNATRNCKAGRYVGEYSCRLFIVVAQGDGAFDVSGTIDMRLEQTLDGELLRISDGRFMSATLAAIPVAADIVGELDCSASRFQGRLENGTFSVALGLPIPFTEGTFAGPLGASYEPSTGTLSGTWDMMGQLAGFPGTCMNGSWSARWIE